MFDENGLSSRTRASTTPKASARPKDFDPTKRNATQRNAPLAQPARPVLSYKRGENEQLELAIVD
jgi:hypothetical protein